MKEEREKIEEITKCPNCGCTNFKKDFARAEIVCEKCGLVIDDSLIDPRPARTFAEGGEKKVQHGAPMTPTLPDKSLSTEIGYKDPYGRTLPMKTTVKMYRLRKWQRRFSTHPKKGANLAAALSEIDRMTSVLELPRNVRETASAIYRKAAKDSLISGRSINKVAAAALYAACRQCKVPRGLNEIADVSGESRKKIGRTYRFISKEFGLKLMPTSAVDYIPRFCDKLGLSREVSIKATEISKKAVEEELISGRGPTGIAAASIYIAGVLCGERKTQKEVAGVAGVTEVTIRNRYKELTEKLDIDIVL